MANELAARKGKKDMYANVAYGTVVMSAANTLTYSQIQMAVGLFQGVAMLVHRVLWYPFNATIREMVAATDSMIMALTSSNRLTTIADVTDPSILVQRRLVGVGANTEIVSLPIIEDFTNLPGGGKLIASNPIWVAGYSGGFAAAGTISVQLDFTFIELSSADYLELLQAQFPANL